MRLEKEFRVEKPREAAIAVIEQDETLIDLFPDTHTEIVERTADRRTTRSQYRALGAEGVATFHFTFLVDGNVRFEKVCDGRIWQELRGEMTFDDEDGGTRVRIEMDGRTKAFVPEFTIKGTMQEQLEQMSLALQDRIESS